MGLLGAGGGGGNRQLGKCSETIHDAEFVEEDEKGQG